MFRKLNLANICYDITCSIKAERLSFENLDILDDHDITCPKSNSGKTLMCKAISFL